MKTLQKYIDRKEKNMYSIGIPIYVPTHTRVNVEFFFTISI